jgi:AmmeMemoRadiSam system protein B
VGALAEHLAATLSTSGFLEDAAFEEMRAARHRDFAAAPMRKAAHAGSGYPDEPGALREFVAAMLAEAGDAGPQDGALVGIAAPHVSPDGGRLSYASAYRALTPDLGDRTFVILGTSHYGTPGRFGLTRKPFETPLGVTTVDAARIEALIADAGPAVVVEDYCHAVEHSIEFQVVFLQHLYGAAVRILPILCGALGPGAGRPAPGDDPDLTRFLATLSSVCSDTSAVVWVAGIDMAHIGTRYGDRVAVVANEGPMRSVATRDRERCEALAAGDAGAFWRTIDTGDGDPLSWCGSSAAYALLEAARPRRGTLRHYEQWNIDEGSVVTFAGMAFYR